MSVRVKLSAAIAALVIAAPALAQDATDAFKGKTVTLVAGSSTGGGLDVYARLLSRHLSRHIPGAPTVIVQNMPGAGSLTAARHLYSIAPKDGTSIGIVLPGALLDPLLTGQDLKSYDPTKFNYIINGNAETIVCVTRRDAPVKDFAQVFDTELVVGGTGPGSSLVDYPIVTRTLMGAKVKLIAGYKGSREVSLAVQQGEVHGVCGLAWSSAKQQYPDVFKPDGLVKVLVQEDSKRHPELIALNVPLSIDYAKTPEQRTALEILYSQGVISRPFIAPPGVPQDRVALLRKAFAAAIADPELQSEAERSKIDAKPISGEEVQALVDRIYASPKPVIEMLSEAMATKK